MVDGIGKTGSLVSRVAWASARRLKRAGGVLLEPPGGARPADPAKSTPTTDDLVKQYVEHGRVPWSPGYKAYRNAMLQEVVLDAALLAAFREGEPLPAGYA